jgi:hypothetical protein
VKTPARFALVAAVLAALACTPGSSGPSGPSTGVVSLTYVPSAASASCSSPAVILCSGSCAHHYAPSNLRVSGSWNADTRLSACGEAYCAVLPGAPLGPELMVLLIDIAQCCRDCSADVRETVYANGTRLTRFVVGEAGRAGGLAFTIDRNGVVTP